MSTLESMARQINKELSPEQLKRIADPLPAEAVQPHPTKAYLSTIKAIYVTERFNQVFGTGVWQLRIEEKPMVGKMAIVKVIFIVPEYNIHLESFGGNDNIDTGDAYKGATTDAITKIASFIGIGANVFKGLAKLPIMNAQQFTSVKERMEAQKGETAQEVFTKAMAAFQATGEQYTQLLDIIK